METVQFLAQLWGFSMVVVGLALLLNAQRAKGLIAHLEQEHAMVAHGVVRFVLGLAMVLTYNVWDQSWKVIITLLGWMLLLTGAYLLLVPKSAAMMMAKLRNGNTLSIALTVIVLVGCALIYFSVKGV